MVATVVLRSDDQAITPPTGWTLAYRVGTTGSAGELTVATFYSPVLVGNALTIFSFTWTTSASAAVFLSQYPTATTVETFSNNSTVTNTSTPQSPAVSVGAGVPRGVLYTLGYNCSSVGVPSYTLPSGFGQLTTVQGNADVAVAHSFLYPVAAGSFGPTTSTLSSAFDTVAGMIVVY